ncbi:hypothetical protein DM860_008911 [Cuscuta australis]|uniref:Uncharacterized protein n=1 Tax=Cuscuta australis TaxID=267555 RepID=A0A328DBJ3_9ASTE|nr:hypothetical protein DM860_008911 [Cuscuta australis]
MTIKIGSWSSKNLSYAAGWDITRVARVPRKPMKQRGTGYPPRATLQRPRVVVTERQVRSTLIGLYGRHTRCSHKGSFRCHKPVLCDLFPSGPSYSRCPPRQLHLQYSDQPLISNIDTAREAWLNLHSSFASTSRGHVLSLKSKLAKNPRGDRSIVVYLHEMHSLANELAFIQNPIPQEDFVSHIQINLGLIMIISHQMLIFVRRTSPSRNLSSMSGRSFGNSGHASSFSSHDVARSPQGRH